MRGNITEELKRRVLVLDGAMGTMIQRLEFCEQDFRGEKFAAHTFELKGCNDLLCLTQPDAISRIHKAYVDAGADIIETNTFNANAISLSDYALSEYVAEINMAGAAIARQVAGENAWVAGSMGPTNVSLSVPTGHNQTFDTVADAYYTQALALIQGGVDLLLVETVFDPINAKAAFVGARRAMYDAGKDMPLMVSATLTEAGRLLSGQTLEAFVTTLENARPLTVGLNCGFGADVMLTHLPQLAGVPYFTSAHPNAGLPDEMGNYVETPEKMAADVKLMLERKLVNIVGGCCGTTPEHISAIAAEAHKANPRKRPVDEDDTLRLSGLEAMHTDGFIKVGERCNVAGSRKFLRLIKEGKIGEAVDIAADQIRAGASVLDINMDDGMLDAREEMCRFVNAIGVDSRTASVPLMIDSSDMGVITAALKQIQGRAVVNSISLKEGEGAFLKYASEIFELGAAVVVMAFDEAGQADTLERRIEICRRAYRLLTEKVGFRGRDIVFDPNVLTVATGIEAHDNYALDFINATGWIHENLPGAKVSGGISNLSFAFRGHNKLREAMHSIFIAHARERGLEMAIVNPTTPIDSAGIEPELAEAINDVLLNRRPAATEQLLAVAARMDDAPAAKPASAPGKKLTLEEMVVEGSAENIEAVLSEELECKGSAMAVIDGCLMAGMNRVGEQFGQGKMFLPQVVRSATVMKRAVEILTPRIEAESGLATTVGGTGRKTMVLATVKGDVHDIGKNIVAVVMRCSGFNVVDLGVMVSAEEIVDAALNHAADFVGLSGLITPSLKEMAKVAELMQKRGLKIPLFVGGATTSELHTAVKLAPLYDGGVIHTADAASMPGIAKSVSDPETATIAMHEILRTQEEVRAAYGAPPELPIESARSLGEQVEKTAECPTAKNGVYDFMPGTAEVEPLINWRAFLGEWRMDPNDKDAEAKRLICDAKKVISGLKGSEIKARAIICSARRTDADEIEINDGELIIPTPRSLQPNQVTGKCPALSDFVAAQDDHVALFAVTVDMDIKGTVDYDDMLRQTVAHRLAEAATEWLNRKVCVDLWGLGAVTGIRPAVGYPSLPNQSLIKDLDKLLKYSELGVTVTENGAMAPSATTSGLIIVHPKSRYFSVVPRKA